MIFCNSAPPSTAGNLPSTYRLTEPHADFIAKFKERRFDRGRKHAYHRSLIMLAFFCSAAMSAFCKEAGGPPRAPPLLMLFLQYGISFLVFVPSAIISGPTKLKTEHLWLLLLRSLAGSFCQLLFFIAVRSIPLWALFCSLMPHPYSSRFVVYL
jgi:hypothetical protein